MRLSVIVPVRNDAHRLATCLASLAADGAGRLDLVVADNGSTDGSAQVALDAGAHVLRLPDLKVSQLRNEAARAAAGDCLAFVDADHQVLDGWTSAALDVMTDETVGAAGAKYLAPADGTWVQQMYGALRGRTTGAGETDWLGSGNMIVRRSAFDRIGGFDGSLEACEDVDLCRRLRAAGFRIVADERLKSIHHGDPRTLAALFRAERWRGRDNLVVSLRGPFTLRDLPSITAPVAVLGALAVIVVSLIASLAGLSAARLAWMAAAVIAVIVLGRTARIAMGLERRTARALARASAVSLAYDLARAVALVTFSPHHRQ